jgi:heptosyltransferase I
MDSSLPLSPTSELSPRILIVRLSAHGDVMHTLPLARAIKRQTPEAIIGWLVEASAVSLLEGHPDIDKLHISQRKRWLNEARNPLRWPAIIREISMLVRELRSCGYQMSFDVQGLLKSAVWPWLARIPKRYGFKATREWADRFYTQCLPPMIIRDTQPFAVERYLDFARAVGYSVSLPEFQVPPVSEGVQQKVNRLLAARQADRLLVVLAPFTRWPTKHWEAEYWPQLILELLKLDVHLAILGAPGDQQATAAMLATLPPEQAQASISNLVGQTDWPDLYALFAQTSVLIGLDSAPLHIANAVGVPRIIGLYGPTAAGRTGPIGKRHATLSTALSCQPCFERNCPLGTHECMIKLKPSMITALVASMLGKPVPIVSEGEGTVTV